MTEETITVTQPVYIAFDGKKFDRKKDCIIYEATIKSVRKNISSIKVNINRDISRCIDEYIEVTGLNRYYNDIEVYLVNINSQEDAERACLFCQIYDGSEEHSISQFSPGNQYLICIGYTSVEMTVRDVDVFVLSYQEVLNFYKDTVEKLEKILDNFS